MNKNLNVYLRSIIVSDKYAFVPKHFTVKFDDHLAAYLYEHKSLKLEGIGIFTLDEKVRVPNEQEKEVYYPIEGLSFTYDPKCTTDEDIIFYLIKKLHKIEPLIRSDLEYYLYNIRVFLNIGNPYTIAGIGTLSKNNQGIFEFTPGDFLPAKEELNLKRENAARNKQVRSTFVAGRFFVIILVVISALAVISAVSWGILNLPVKQSLSNENPDQQGHIDTIAQQEDTIVHTINTVPVIKDTDTFSKDTPVFSPAATFNTIANKVDSVTFKMVFEVTKSKERAHSRTAQLKDLHSYTQYDSIPINDSVAYYRLFLIVKINPADTTRVKDSLQTFFGKKIFMEKNKD